MANPRRNSYSSTFTTSEQQQSQSSSIPNSLKSFLKKPHAFPFLLSIFLLLTWLCLRLEHLHNFSPKPTHNTQNWSGKHNVNKEDGDDGDGKANLVRFNSAFPSPISRDKRGWLFNPVTLAHDSGISGGAVSCGSAHLGEIRPGGLRGNHRHYTCNETFIIWGARTKFRKKGTIAEVNTRVSKVEETMGVIAAVVTELISTPATFSATGQIGLENPMVDKGYAEVIIGADEVAVASSPSGMAHALVNVDSMRTTFFLGCQDDEITYNSSSTDFNVWKDL